MSLKLKRSFDAFSNEDAPLQCPQPTFSFMSSFSPQKEKHDNMHIDESTAPIKKKKFGLVEGIRTNRPNHFPTSDQINLSQNQYVFDNDFSNSISTPKRRQQRLFTEEEVRK